VRLANLRSGQLDFIERLAPSDVPGLKGDSRFKIDKIVEIGYQGITINVGKSDLAQKNPLGKDARVREAFELSLDRDAIVKVAMEGEAVPGNQWVAPTNQYYGKSAPIAKRNVERAKQLLKEAGVPSPSFTLMTPTTSDAQRIAQVVQAMAKDAGFDVKIQGDRVCRFTEPRRQGTVRGLRDRVERPRRSRRQPAHDASRARGRPTTPATARTMFEKLIDESRTSLDPVRRAAAYDKIAQQVAKDRPIIYLYPPQLALGAHRQADWAARGARRHGAGAGLCECKIGTYPILMLKYLLQRLALVVPTLFFVSV
jgi:peptide/nickel transport system substrate-binding protein